jgi:uncharacterized protein (TIGR02391 family)
MDTVMRSYLEHLHPYISKGCSALFNNEHYPQASEEAAKAVFQYLRDKTAVDEDGAKLAQTVFSEKAPILAFSKLTDITQKNEQVGFMEMLAGFAKGVRNPLAHSHGGEQARQRAFEYLVVASLLCRRIDEAHDTELDKTSHPAGQEAFREERMPCTFEINPKYTDVPGTRWDDNADLAVHILKPVNRARVFLIPSANAPVEYADPQWWKDNQPLLDEKKKIVAAFASQNLSRPIRGVVFLHKFKKGGSAQTAYSSAFDQFLHTGRKANSKSA